MSACWGGFEEPKTKLNSEQGQNVVRAKSSHNGNIWHPALVKLSLATHIVDIPTANASMELMRNLGANEPNQNTKVYVNVVSDDPFLDNIPTAIAIHLCVPETLLLRFPCPASFACNSNIAITPNSKLKITGAALQLGSFESSKLFSTLLANRVVKASYIGKSDGKNNGKNCHVLPMQSTNYDRSHMVSHLFVNWRGEYDWLVVRQIKLPASSFKKNKINKANGARKSPLFCAPLICRLANTTNVYVTPLTSTLYSSLLVKQIDDIPASSIDAHYKQILNAVCMSIGGCSSTALTLIKQVSKVLLNNTDYNTRQMSHQDAYLQRKDSYSSSKSLMQSMVLVGPSGCGKSLLVNTIAAVMHQPCFGGISVFHVNADILSSSSGKAPKSHPEEKIHQLFQQIRCNAPSLVIVDDLPLLAPKRSRQIGIEMRNICTMLAYELQQCKTFLQSEMAGKDIDNEMAFSHSALGVAFVTLATTLTGVDDEILAPSCLGGLTLHMPAMDSAARLDALEVIFGRPLVHKNHQCSAIPSKCDSSSHIFSQDHNRAVAKNTDPRDCLKRCFPKKGMLLKWVANHTVGFIGADLQALCRDAILNYVAETSNPTNNNIIESDYRFNKHIEVHIGALRQKHFEQALYYIQPSLLKTTDRFADDVVLARERVSSANQRTNVRKIPQRFQVSNHAYGVSLAAFSELPGLQDVHEQLARAVIAPLTKPSQLQYFGLSQPRGILLHGPPGTGKTSTGLALREAVDGAANFICVTCTSIVDKELGATEKAIASIFAKARSVAPCILFLDQIEALAPVRGFDQSSELTFDRLLSCLLTEMDGVASSSTKNYVVVVATTVNKQWLDPSILRPGRFDEHIEFKLPTCRMRELVLFHKLCCMPLDLSHKAMCNMQGDCTKQCSKFDDDTGIEQKVPRATMRTSDLDSALSSASADEEFTRNESDSLLPQQQTKFTISNDEISNDSNISRCKEVANKNEHYPTDETLGALVRSLAMRTAGLSHADLCNIVQESAMRALRQDIKTPTLKPCHLLDTISALDRNFIK